MCLAGCLSLCLTVWLSAWLPACLPAPWVAGWVSGLLVLSFLSFRVQGCAKILGQMWRDLTDEEAGTLKFLDEAAFANVRALVGLDALRVGVTGAAPIPNQILEWFHAVGINLTEIYGLSETSGPLSWSPERNKIGAVGRACHGLEIKIAEDGEVLARGGNMFVGYLGLPDKTAETIDNIAPAPI